MAKNLFFSLKQADWPIGFGVFRFVNNGQPSANNTTSLIGEDAQHE